MFLGKGLLKTSSKFTGEYPCRSAISNVYWNRKQITVHNTKRVKKIHFVCCKSLSRIPCKWPPVWWVIKPGIFWHPKWSKNIFYKNSIHTKFKNFLMWNLIREKRKKLIYNIINSSYNIIVNTILDKYFRLCWHMQGGTTYILHLYCIFYIVIGNGKMTFLSYS